MVAPLYSAFSEHCEQFAKLSLRVEALEKELKTLKSQIK